MEEVWDAITSHLQLFPITVPKEFISNPENHPKPFPKLSDLFTSINEDLGKGIVQKLQITSLHNFQVPEVAAVRSIHSLSKPNLLSAKTSRSSLVCGGLYNLRLKKTTSSTTSITHDMNMNNNNKGNGNQCSRSHHKVLSCPTYMTTTGDKLGNVGILNKSKSSFTYNPHQRQCPNVTTIAKNSNLVNRVHFAPSAVGYSVGKTGQINLQAPPSPLSIQSQKSMSILMNINRNPITSTSQQRLAKLQISPVDSQQLQPHDSCRPNLKISETTLYNLEKKLSSSHSSVMSLVSKDKQDLSTENLDFKKIIFPKLADTFNDTDMDVDDNKLLGEGIELLNAGRSLIEEKAKEGEIQTQTLQDVANKLKDIVEGELMQLKEENSTLRTENLLLKERLIAFVAANGSKSGDNNKIESSSSSDAENEERNNNFNLSKESFSPKGDSKHLLNLKDKSTEEQNKIMSSLNEAILQLKDSNGRQFGKFQDRLYQQELRYEETLSKFEDITAHLTKMFDTLRHTYNSLPIEQRSSESTRQMLDKTAENLTAIAKKCGMNRNGI